MGGTKRETWGGLRKVPTDRWQARYPAPDGDIYTARTEDDKALTFVTKTDAPRWLAAVQTKISLGQWEPPAVTAARRHADAEAESARFMGFEEYSRHWLQLVKTEPNRSGKMRAVGTVRSYKGKVSGYLLPEFGDTSLKEIASTSESLTLFAESCLASVRDSGENTQSARHCAGPRLMPAAEGGTGLDQGRRVHRRHGDA